MKIVIFGLTITSSWGNGHATTFRSLSKALAERRHDVHFVEKDMEWYRNNRDLPQPDFCKVHLYEEWNQSYHELLQITEDADAIIIGSYYPDAIAVTEALLEAGRAVIFFYDIDTPVTLSRLRTQGSTEYLQSDLIPYYAAYLSFTGGPALHELEDRFGAGWAVPFYCSVDPELYRPRSVFEAFQCDLSYLGTYAADRQAKLMKVLNGAAGLLPAHRFIVAGPQYPEDTLWHFNVRRIIHLSPPQHPTFYSSSRFTLNLTRKDMIQAGYSPSVRLFEASACGATILSDSWHGLEDFLTPGEEVLVPRDEYEVSSILRDMSEQERKRMGDRARERILSQHTAQHRAVEFEQIIERCQSVRRNQVTQIAKAEVGPLSH